MGNLVSSTHAGTRHPFAHGLLAAAMMASVLACLGTAKAQAVAQPIAPTSIENRFDSTHYDIVPPKSFEQLKVGDVYRMPSRTLTGALTSAFQAVSLDNNPLHYDDDYAKRHGLPSALIQPMEVLAFTAPGASLFTLYIGDELIAFTELNCKFLEPSFVGDTLYPELEIVQLAKEAGHGIVTMAMAVHNQKGELVLTGQQVFTLKLSFQ